MNIVVNTKVTHPETKKESTFIVHDWGFTGICEPDGSMLRWIAYRDDRPEYYSGHSWKTDYENWLNQMINEGHKCPVH